MTRIGLISDTHGYLDNAVFRHFETCNEIWHAGDFGTTDIVERLRAFRPLRAVWGNIDGAEIRHEMSERLYFTCEGVRVLMQHIGGYPGRYAPGVKAAIRDSHAGLFISGHSHILKVQYDDLLRCLHMNPGAAGRQGWHKVRTVIRFVIDGDKMRDCEVIELGTKAASLSARPDEEP